MACRVWCQSGGDIVRRGGKAAFDTIVCFGANGSEPHYSPGDVPLRRNDMILVDFGAELRDYCSDITRMFLFGEASAEQRAMFDVVRDAQLEAVEMSLDIARAAGTSPATFYQYFPDVEAAVAAMS